MAGVSVGAQTDDGRGDTNERRTPLLNYDGDLSDDSFEYDDESIMRLRLSVSREDTFQDSYTNLILSPTSSAADDSELQTTRPKFPTVQERTDDILKDVRARINGLSDGINELRQQTRNLSSDFVAVERRLTELKPLKNRYTRNAKTQLLQLDELNYLNGLISYLQRVDKEMVLLPCRYDFHGEIFPEESVSNTVNDSIGQSLAELGESYREFSSDESATGL